jgi:hypothetical protein
VSIEPDKFIPAVEARFGFRLAIKKACALTVEQQRVRAVYDATKVLLTNCTGAGLDPLEIITEPWNS